MPPPTWTPITLRGNYWRDRNTRVVQPAIDLRKQLPTGTQSRRTTCSTPSPRRRWRPASCAISRSPSCATRSASPLGQGVGPALITGAYSYSSEIGLLGALRAARRAARRPVPATTPSCSALARLRQRPRRPAHGPDAVQPDRRAADGARRRHADADAVRRQLLLDRQPTSSACSASATPTNGWQANVYRTVNLGGAPARELVPYQRIRQAASAGAPLAHPACRTASCPTWCSARRTASTGTTGACSRTRPSCACTCRSGPSSCASPAAGTRRTTSASGATMACARRIRRACRGSTAPAACSPRSRSGLWYTADPKLGNMTSAFLELRLLAKLRGVRSWNWLPGHDWVAERHHRAVVRPLLQRRLRAHRLRRRRGRGAAPSEWPL